MSLKTVPGISWTEAGLWSHTGYWSASHEVVPVYPHMPGTWSAAQNMTNYSLIHWFHTAISLKFYQKSSGHSRLMRPVSVLYKHVNTRISCNTMLHHALLPFGDSAGPLLHRSEHHWLITIPQQKAKWTEPHPHRKKACDLDDFIFTSISPDTVSTPMDCDSWEQRGELCYLCSRTAQYPYLHWLIMEARSRLAYVIWLEVLIL